MENNLKKQLVLEEHEKLTSKGLCVFGFFGKYRPLSNMHEEPFDWYTDTWPASENAYMALKECPFRPNPAFAKMTPRDAKIAGKKVALYPGWDSYRNFAMTTVLLVKFTRCPVARECLLATKGMQLFEANWWGDTYWGVALKDNGNYSGENRLGQILMTIRDQILN